VVDKANIIITALNLS